MNDHTTTPMLRLSLFGGWQITLGERPIRGFISNKVRALLCYLAISERALPRAALAHLFWGEMPDREARTSLRQALANLRRLLGDYVLTDHDTAMFNPSLPYWVDASQFEALLRHATLGTPNQSATLAQAVNLYAGDFLDGCILRNAPAFDEWAIARRERLRALALHALHTLVEYHTARRSYGAGVDYATRLLLLDPWREEAHRQLMQLLALSGRRDAALAQYEHCCRILNEILGIEPAAETVALYLRILNGSGEQLGTPGGRARTRGCFIRRARPAWSRPEYATQTLG